MEHSSPASRLTWKGAQHGIHGREVSLILHEQQLWHANPAFSLRLIHSLHVEKRNLKLQLCHSHSENAKSGSGSKTKQNFTSKISRTTYRTCVGKAMSFHREETWWRGMGIKCTELGFKKRLLPLLSLELSSHLSLGKWSTFFKS